MSTFSIVLQSLFLVLALTAMAYRYLWTYRVLWKICKDSPIHTEHQLIAHTNARELFPVIAGSGLAAGLFYGIGLTILMIGYPLLVLLGHLVPLSIMFYWRRYHARYASV